MNSTHILDEKELLVKLRDGDARAFDKLYGFYSPRIYKRLLRLTAIEDIATELLQETFITLWEKRESINPDLVFKAWLYKVAENGVYQYYRRVARDQTLQQYILANFTESYSHSEENLILKEQKELLSNAINQLPEQRKKVFVLCKVEGRSYEEVANILGISPSTVSNHLVKANAFVRAYLFRSQHSMLLILAALSSATD